VSPKPAQGRAQGSRLLGYNLFCCVPIPIDDPRILHAGPQLHHGNGQDCRLAENPGDRVEKGENILVVESDKADMDVESFHSGILASILVPAGESAPVGAPIALIAESEAEVAQAQEKAKALAAGVTPAAPPSADRASAAQPTSPAPAATPTSTLPNGSDGAGSQRVVASPRAKKLAESLGIDLRTVCGSGPGAALWPRMWSGQRPFPLLQWLPPLPQPLRPQLLRLSPWEKRFPSALYKRRWCAI
jgi:hypothetical protein